MLWTLHARAAEAGLSDALLDDLYAVRILQLIDYDFTARFGAPNRLFALRAALIDGAIRRWLAHRPDGLVLSLGEGLETQRHRVDNGLMHWLSIDLPEAMRVREMFLSATARFRHLATDVLDGAWMQQVPPAPPPFIVMQGLLMYLRPEQVRALLLGIAGRFPGAVLVFDVVPRELSSATVRGHRQSDTYVLPAMPWGLNRNEIVPTLRRWQLPVRSIRFLPYALHRRRPAPVEAVLDRIVPRRQRLASLVEITLRG